LATKKYHSKKKEDKISVYSFHKKWCHYYSHFSSNKIKGIEMKERNWPQKSTILKRKNNKEIDQDADDHWIVNKKK